MKTLSKVTIKPVFLDGYMVSKNDMEENHIYISEQYETSSHLCLCGCRQLTILPLNKPGGWNLIKENDGTISFIPSILNPLGGHYIITKNVANMLATCMNPFPYDI